MTTPPEQPRQTHAAGKILVTGATGDIGGHLVRALRERGAPFAVMCRRPEQRADFAQRGIEAVAGDFADPQSLPAAMVGIEQLFLLAPDGQDQYQQDRTAIDAAVAAGVHHVVKLSTLDANPTSAIPWARDHARADAYLAGTGVRWTRLAPGAFTKNVLELAPAIRRGLLPGTSGNGATSWVDVHDIGEAAARILTDRSLQGEVTGRTYILTGTHPLSFPEIATILSTELGHRVRYLHLPGPLMLAGLRASGVPGWQARGLVHQFVDVVRRGADHGRVHTTDLEHLLDRTPRGFADLATEHAGELSRGR
jgi:uncharacterized protein YbjT (DUF2867 family)